MEAASDLLAVCKESAAEFLWRCYFKGIPKGSLQTAQVQDLGSSIPSPPRSWQRTQVDKSPQEFSHLFIGPLEFISWLCLGKSCRAATTLARINQLSLADVSLAVPQRVPLRD